MGKHIFTLFEGDKADQGRQFVLSKQPLEIGRDEGRAVVLHDDRASRTHAQLCLDGDTVKILDLNSSNGTFVNDQLVMETELYEGDVITIGNTRIVYGAHSPTGETVLRATPEARRPARAGPATEIMPEDICVQPLETSEVRLSDILEAVAEAARDAAELKGVHVSVEMESEPVRVQIDARQFYHALAMLACALLECYDPVQPVAGTRVESSMVLRAGGDRRGGIAISVIWIGGALSREAVAERERRGELKEALAIVLAHGGTFALLPEYAPSTLVEIRLPGGSVRSTGETIHG